MNLTEMITEGNTIEELEPPAALYVETYEQDVDAQEWVKHSVDGWE